MSKEQYIIDRELAIDNLMESGLTEYEAEREVDEFNN
jgi:hypothetical protein